MKKIEVIFRPEKLEPLKEKLLAAGVLFSFWVAATYCCCALLALSQRLSMVL